IRLKVNVNKLILHAVEILVSHGAELTQEQSELIDQHKRQVLDFDKACSQDECDAEGATELLCSR
ncbi:MAG: hypothetical protein M3R00_04715, partial [Pseudomonadota bacterium]|nr:hypothetical protein [Pseudomonadota bacterium]